jgi:transcriptional regulator with XRE-family HTH domain
MERSQEAALVAAAIRDLMKAQSLTGAELARKIERLTGEPISEMTITRAKNGQVHLTTPRVVEWAPNDMLRKVALGLGVDADELAATANPDLGTVTANRKDPRTVALRRNITRTARKLRALADEIDQLAPEEVTSISA